MYVILKEIHRNTIDKAEYIEYIAKYQLNIRKIELPNKGFHKLEIVATKELNNH